MSLSGTSPVVLIESGFGYDVSAVAEWGCNAMICTKDGKQLFNLNSEQALGLDNYSYVNTADFAGWLL